MASWFKEIWKDLWRSYDAPSYGGCPSTGCIGTMALGVLTLFSGSCYFINQDRVEQARKMKELFNSGQTQIVGEVLDESLEKGYSIRLRTDDGKEIGVSVLDGSKTNKESLDVLVNIGSKISFPTGNIQEDSGTFSGYSEIKEETWFSGNTQCGNKRADRIKVLK